MGGKFVQCAGNLLSSHLDKAAGSEALGRCMDDIMLDSVPPTWPLVTQAYLLGQFDDAYELAANIVCHQLKFDFFFSSDTVIGLSRRFTSPASLALQSNGVLPEPGGSCARLGGCVGAPGALHRDLAQ